MSNVLRTSSSASVGELVQRLDQLSSRELEVVDRILYGNSEIPSFAEYWQRTVSHPLDPWQRDHLAPICERFAWESGVREAIHAPPQFGKSEGVSQRLPPYTIGIAPVHTRVALICFNIQRAAEFGDIVKQLSLDNYHVELFGEDAAIPANASKEGFSTFGRYELRDPQPSFAAYGLKTGLVGRGATHFIIDDPYPNSDMAFSKAYNDMVWRFLKQTLLPRIDPYANVLLMFHRYHPDDMAGRAVASKLFHYTRLPAIADENEDGADPTGRAPGEILSPRKTAEQLKQQQESDPQVWKGQFQGLPEPPGGTLIQRTWLHTIPERNVPRIDLWVRFWDLAAKKTQTSDYTAGALTGIGPRQEIYLKDMARFRESWPNAQELILQVTAADMLWIQRLNELDRDLNARYLVGVEDVFWQDPMIQDLLAHRMFRQVQLVPVPPMGDKKMRASGWITRAKYGGFFMVEPADPRKEWDRQAFIDEAIDFNGLGLTHDDQIDGVSGSWSLTWAYRGGALEVPPPPPSGSYEYYRQLEKHARAQRGGSFEDWDDDE